MDTLAFMELSLSPTRNIRALKKAGSLYKYDGHEPDISHYNLIELEIHGRDKNLMAALSKKVKQKKELEKIDKEIEEILLTGVDI